MDLSRINLKFFLDEWEVLPEEIFRIFNTWISTTTDEVLVDVADYSHVHAGPITLLVGHEANYCIDNTDEKIGLLYTRKQPLDGGMSDRFRRVFTAALRACQRLEQEPELKGKVEFRGGEVLLVANDRLHAPGTQETQNALKADLEGFLQALYGGTEFALESTPVPAPRPAIRIKSSTEFDVTTLLKNLEVN